MSKAGNVTDGGKWVLRMHSRTYGNLDQPATQILCKNAADA